MSATPSPSRAMEVSRDGPAVGVTFDADTRVEAERPLELAVAYKA